MDFYQRGNCLCGHHNHTYIATSRCQNWSVGGTEREGEKRAEVDELAAGEELLLFLPTPSFMASADDEG